MSLRSVLLPVAGRGTRLLPATKATPKELLPVYDTPLLSFALREAVMARAERIVLVSHRDKPGIEAFARRDGAEAARLRANGKDAQANALDGLELPDDVDVTIVYQDEPLGLGHAVLCGADAVLPGPFGVILPDDVMFSGTCLSDMAREYPNCGATSLVGAMTVAPHKTSSYGIFDLDQTDGAAIPARGLVEKPVPENAPSRLAAIGRYVLSEDIFDRLRQTRPGAGGEIQLTDAIDALSGLFAYRIAEARYDCGDKEGLLNASIALRALRNGADATRVAAA